MPGARRRCLHAWGSSCSGSSADLCSQGTLSCGRFGASAKLGKMLPIFRTHDHVHHFSKSRKFKNCSNKKCHEWLLKKHFDQIDVLSHNDSYGQHLDTEMVNCSIQHLFKLSFRSLRTLCATKSTAKCAD
jgi:hypothetical protein